MGASLIKGGFLDSSVGKESACKAGDPGSIPGREDPLEKDRLPTPVFWPREFHGQRSVAGYSPWGRKELDMAEQLMQRSPG